MKKELELILEPRSAFFLGLRDKFLEVGEFGIGGTYANQYVDAVVSSTFQVLKKELGLKNPSATEKIKYKFEHEEYVLPEIHSLLEESIDVALNRKIHSTTLERFADFIVDYMVEVADKQTEDKKIKIPIKVDPNAELTAITQYISNTWDGFDKVDVSAFISEIWKACVEKTKNQFDEYVFYSLVEVWQAERTDFSKWQEAGSKIKEDKFQSALLDDKIKELPYQIIMANFGLNRFIRNTWDYEKNVNEILSSINEYFPEANKLKPKGWSKLSRGYRDFDGMNQFDSDKARAEFGGMNSGTAGSSSFEVRVSLPHVMYDDKCQGRKPLEVLVGAMLGHAYVMSQKNNASKMITEWVALKAEYDKPEYYQQPVKKLDLEFKEPMNQALHVFFSENKKEGENLDKKLKTILGIREPQKKKKKMTT